MSETSSAEELDWDQWCQHHPLNLRRIRLLRLRHRLAEAFTRAMIRQAWSTAPEILYALSDAGPLG